MAEFNINYEELYRYIGQTVTIFTESGGLSGSGFSGVLAGICNGTVKLITCIGAAPCCPVGSSCNEVFSPFGYGNTGFSNSYGLGSNCGCCCGGGGFNTINQTTTLGFGSNWLGSVTEIPLCKIVSFTHNAI